MRAPRCSRGRSHVKPVARRCGVGALLRPLVSRSVGDCLRVIRARTLPWNSRRGLRMALVGAGSAAAFSITLDGDVLRYRQTPGDSGSVGVSAIPREAPTGVQVSTIGPSDFVSGCRVVRPGGLGLHPDTVALGCPLAPVPAERVRARTQGPNAREPRPLRGVALCRFVGRWARSGLSPARRSSGAGRGRYQGVRLPAGSAAESRCP